MAAGADPAAGARLPATTGDAVVGVVVPDALVSATGVTPLVGGLAPVEAAAVPFAPAEPLPPFACIAAVIPASLAFPFALPPPRAPLRASAFALRCSLSAMACDGGLAAALMDPPRARSISHRRLHSSGVRFGRLCCVIFEPQLHVPLFTAICRSLSSSAKVHSEEEEKQEEKQEEEEEKEEEEKEAAGRAAGAEGLDKEAEAEA
eukprot:scaffold191429_cov19-Tisochrysis_lutea.AAC.2